MTRNTDKDRTEDTGWYVEIPTFLMLCVGGLLLSLAYLIVKFGESLAC